jgi:RNA polymerase sigma-70 factor, ECF subfamily
VRRGRSFGRHDLWVDAGDVYRQLAPAVRGYLRGQRVRDPDDLLGEVFLQVARSLPRFRGNESEDLRRWVFTIARNRVIDEGRRRARRPHPARFDGAPETAVRPDDGPLDPDLLRALGTLTPDQREVVGLRFIADLSLEDVARITGRSTGAVKAMQARGLASLARILDPSPSAE